MKEIKIKKGWTIIEVVLATVIGSLVFLVAANSYFSNQKMYYNVLDKSIISGSFQYVIEHINKYTSQAMGDASSPAIEDPAGGSTLSIWVNNNDPLTSSNYSSRVNYKYRLIDEVLEFSNNGDLAYTALIPDVKVTDAAFTLDGNVLTVSLTGRKRQQKLTFYTSCYPRLATF